jgi:ribonuclease VapC
VIAILRNEPEAPHLARAIQDAAQRRISAVNFVEAAAVIDASRRFDELLRVARVVIEPVTEEQAKTARAAYRDFGKGSGHPAKLNAGDYFAYAPAKTSGEALLFKGNDFRHTDVMMA